MSRSSRQRNMIEGQEFRMRSRRSGWRSRRSGWSSRNKGAEAEVSMEEQEYIGWRRIERSIGWRSSLQKST